VGFITHAMAAIFASISLSDNIDFTTRNEMSLTISAMHNNKAPDCHVCAEHFKLAGQFYYSILAYCFSAMFVHGHMPAAATETVIYLFIYLFIYLSVLLLKIKWSLLYRL